MLVTILLNGGIQIPVNHSAETPQQMVQDIREYQRGDGRWMILIDPDGITKHYIDPQAILGFTLKEQALQAKTFGEPSPTAKQKNPGSSREGGR